MRGLLKAYGIKRVYILGAGFSAPLGLPLTRDLLRLAYGVAERTPWYLEGGECSPHGQADWILEKINWYFPFADSDHQSIVSGRSDGFDMERFLSYAAASSASGERWSEHGDKFVSFLKTHLAQAVVEEQWRAMSTVPPAYIKFADMIAKSLVITFNWDTVVENLLDKAGRKYAFDLQSTFETDATPIIKLHGSVDWFSEPEEPWRKDWMNFRPLTENFEGCVRATGNLVRYYESFLTPWIVMPAYDKVSQILKLGDLWQSPWMYLQDELEVVIIGFSMRPDDFHTRAFIYPQLVHGSLAGRLSVKVIDYAINKDQQHAIRDRYAGVENCEYWLDGFSERALEFIEAG